jgi:hypothetical protein
MLGLDLDKPEAYLKDKEGLNISVHIEDVWYHGNMTVISWVPPVKESGVVIEKGYW